MKRHTRCAVLAFAAVAALAMRQQPDAAGPGVGGPGVGVGDDGRFAKALADYRAGRYEAALEGFRQELAARGADAPAAVRLDLGLAALRLLRSRDAEQAVQPLLAPGGDPEHAADAAFVLGLAAWQDAERAVAAANLPDAEPMAWTMAVRAIDRAAGAFQRAAELRRPWPEAIRNTERALRRRLEIEAARDAAAKPDAKKEEAPVPPPPTPPAPDQPPEEVVAEVSTAQLTAEQLRKLQERVRVQQREKLQLRQATPSGAVVGGRDW